MFFIDLGEMRRWIIARKNEMQGSTTDYGRGYIAALNAALGKLNELIEARK